MEEKAVKKGGKAWIFIALGALVMLLLGLRLYREYYDRKVPNFNGTREFYVRPDMEPSEVMDTLLSSGIVLNKKSLRRTLEPLTSM